MKRAKKKPGKSAMLPACVVMLAGGRGTRFWPRSRRRTPKQLLNIVGSRTMVRETLARLSPLFSPKNAWIVTNKEQLSAMRRELPDIAPSRVLTEPAGVNTAAAIALAAIHLIHEHGDALMAVLPSDAYIADAAGYRALVRSALDLARTPGNLVVIGISPTRPETGYGYIERGVEVAKPRGVAAYAVRRFTEKPELGEARKYLESGEYFWNAGMFFWSASTFLENLRRFLPATHEAMRELAKYVGTRRYPPALRRVYPKLQNISVDYAIMEPATRNTNTAQSNVLVIPANVGWSDIGSWAAVYELLAAKPGANVSAGASFALDAEGNFLWSPKKFIAAIGVHDLVLVETEDALLLCSRERSQDVGKIVKWLEEQRLDRHV
ncbi:MAG: sugar phosphate nucleotidyltransferase [Candidatus Acidiferrales bacterium]